MSLRTTIAGSRAGKSESSSRGKQMNKSRFAVVGFVLILTACATGGLQRAYKPFGVVAQNVTSVSVDVLDDQYIVISQEPAYVKQDDDNKIYWYLNPAGPYYFPDTGHDHGIDFQQPQPAHLSCHLNAGDKFTFVCEYTRSSKRKYFYTIKVTKDGTTMVVSDPTVMNN
jgi:hypothetical protein